MFALPLLLGQTDPSSPIAADRLSVARPACPAGPGSDGDVVVCGRVLDQRLRPLPPLPEASHAEAAAFGLPGGGVGRFRVIETTLPGATGHGVALTLTMPFGHKRAAASQDPPAR